MISLQVCPKGKIEASSERPAPAMDLGILDPTVHHEAESKKKIL
jgi:hypothetical protein